VSVRYNGAQNGKGVCGIELARDFFCAREAKSSSAGREIEGYIRGGENDPFWLGLGEGNERVLGNLVEAVGILILLP
jgi:hypothetical protein